MEVTHDGRAEAVSAPVHSVSSEVVDAEVKSEQQGVNINSAVVEGDQQTKRNSAVTPSN